MTLLGAARWYSKQESVVQASLDNAEPLTWLKHLLEKRGRRTSRLPWHLTALIVEEYAKSRDRPEPMETIPEDGAPSGSTHAPGSSPFVISVVSPESKSTGKSSGSWSWSPPPQALEPSLSRKRATSVDGQISFEPQVDSGRESAYGSRRSSMEPLSSRARGTGAESPGSSTRSSKFSRGLVMSPASGRMQFRDFAKRMRRKPAEGSEDGFSSARGSLSEHSHDDEAAVPSKGKGRSRPLSLQLRSTLEGTMSEEERAALSLSDRGALSSGGEGPLTARQGLSPYVTPPEPPATVPDSLLPPESRIQSPEPPRPRRPAPPLRRRRLSLPSLHLLMQREEEKRQQEADEEVERHEYDHKTQ